MLHAGNIVLGRMCAPTLLGGQRLGLCKAPMSVLGITARVFFQRGSVHVCCRGLGQGSGSELGFSWAVLGRDLGVGGA